MKINQCHYLNVPNAKDELIRYSIAIIVKESHYKNTYISLPQHIANNNQKLTFRLHKYKINRFCTITDSYDMDKINEKEIQ